RTRKPCYGVADLLLRTRERREMRYFERLLYGVHKRQRTIGRDHPVHPVGGLRLQLSALSVGRPAPQTHVLEVRLVHMAAEPDLHLRRLRKSDDEHVLTVRAAGLKLGGGYRGNGWPGLSADLHDAQPERRGNRKNVVESL